jgi:hypothetical protein
MKPAVERTHRSAMSRSALLVELGRLQRALVGVAADDLRLDDVGGAGRDAIDTSGLRPRMFASGQVGERAMFDGLTWPKIIWVNSGELRRSASESTESSRWVGWKAM